MQVEVTPLTDIELVRKACASTTGLGSQISYESILNCEHSPCRCLMYWVELKDIPTFVSVHLTRHKIGVEHFVKSNRPDRGGEADVDRQTPVTHSMLINAQSLINIARRRLCTKASKETREVVEAIKQASPDYLKPFLVPECEYRGGYCHERRYCGREGIHPVRPSQHG